MRRKFFQIERCVATLLKPVVFILKILLYPLSFCYLTSRCIRRIDKNLVVIRVNKRPPKEVKHIIKLFKQNKYNVIVSQASLKPNSYGLNDVIISKNSIYSRIAISKANIVVFSDSVAKLPAKKNKQVFVYIGDAKISKQLDRKIDIKIPRKSLLKVTDADIKKIKEFSNLQQIQKFNFFFARDGKKEAFIRVKLRFYDLFLYGLLYEWLINYIANIADYKIRQVMRYALSKLSHIIPVNDNLVVVYNNFNQYSCNIKYIVNKLSDESNKKIVYLINKYNADLAQKRNVIQVDPRSIRAIFYLCRAKIWIYNSIKNPEQAQKKKTQIFIQTWHGSLGIKRVDPEFIYDKEWLRKANLNTDITDVCISNSKFESEMYRTCYWSKSDIWEIGHPRNDILFSDNTLLRKKICETYSIDENSLIFLYAPTYREDYDSSAYITDFESIKVCLELRFNKPVTIAVRYHHWFLKRAPKNVIKKLAMAGVVDLSSHEDMQEILASVDIGCTDYSSWIYDFVLTRKPAFIYSSDIDQFLTFRGFYYPLSETPFPLAKTMDELITNILDFSQDEYMINVEKFLDARGCLENGKATELFMNNLNALLKNSSV